VEEKINRKDAKEQIAEGAEKKIKLKLSAPIVCCPTAFQISANTHLVISLHTCPCEKTRSQLKYKANGLMRSTAHAAVVKNAPVKYSLDIKGISMYLIKWKLRGVKNNV
jgi:hypothetical protein